jgi:hypothetical protein
VIDFEGQVLEWEVLRLPCIHKAAELIFTAYGSDFEEYRQSARNRFKEAMKVELFSVDVNNNARIDPRERSNRVGRLIR